MVAARYRRRRVFGRTNSESVTLSIVLVATLIGESRRLIVDGNGDSVIGFDERLVLTHAECRTQFGLHERSFSGKSSATVPFSAPPDFESVCRSAALS